MNIVISANNNRELLVFPVVPPDVEVSCPHNNEEFETINNGTLNLIGDMGLRTLSISSIFPTQRYNWIKTGASSNGWDYVDYLQRWRKIKTPVRIIATTEEGKEWLNMACTIDNFTYGLMRNKDIKYTLELKEYRFMGVQRNGDDTEYKWSSYNGQIYNSPY